MEQRSEGGYLAAEKLDEVLFGENPYGHQNPTPESIAKLDIAALPNFRDSYLAPNNGVLIVLGVLPLRSDLMKLLPGQFGDWPKHAIPHAATPPIPAPKKSLTLVDRPGSVQADVHICHLGVTRASPAYFPLAVGSTVLGGGTPSRLFNEIRERQDYAY